MRTVAKRPYIGMSEATQRATAVVDDDSAVRDSLRLLLEVLGYLVKTFASAAELLLLNTGLQNLACLILDHHMPHMTSLELAERLRADGAAIPILLITASPSPAIFARAAEIDIRVLEKPPGDEELLDFISASQP
jgi:FixJ family two-component response regulator